MLWQTVRYSRKLRNNNLYKDRAAMWRPTCCLWKEMGVICHYSGRQLFLSLFYNLQSLGLYLAVNVPLIFKGRTCAEIHSEYKYRIIWNLFFLAVPLSHDQHKLLPPPPLLLGPCRLAPTPAFVWPLLPLSLGPCRLAPVAWPPPLLLLGPASAFIRPGSKFPWAPGKSFSPEMHDERR